MRLVFISSVTAMTPLRTISAITGSSGLRFVRSIPICFVVFRAIALLPAGVGWVEPPGPAFGRPDGKLSETHHHPCRCPRWVSLRSTHPTVSNSDTEIAEAVDLQGVAGHQYGRRCMFLDQRRTLDTIARS